MHKERVSWRIATAIWWAQLWRSWLVMFVVVMAIAFVVTIIGHGSPESVKGFIESGAGTAFEVAILIVWLVVQIWAVRESIGNRYKSFELRFHSKEKT